MEFLTQSLPIEFVYVAILVLCAALFLKVSKSFIKLIVIIVMIYILVVRVAPMWV